jgi:UDP-galactopyranose mutase
MHNVETGADLIVISSNAYASDELRTSHVMKSFAESKRVFFFEAPIIGVTENSTYFLKKEDNGITIIKPYLPRDFSVFDKKHLLLNLLKEMILDENITHYTIWTDTPKAMPLIRSLSAEIIIYDCLNDYSASHLELEKELFQYADVVLTSGMSKLASSSAAVKEKRPGPPTLILVPTHEDESIKSSGQAFS